jgi:hypothetical protein
MSIVDVTKMWSKDGGAITSEQADAFDLQFAFTEGYQVLVDADHEPFFIAQMGITAGLPTIGDQHPSGVNAFVKSVRPQRVAPRFWMVEIGYEGVDNSDATVDVEWTDVTTTEPIDRAWGGEAIVTANNEQVDGLSVDVADQVVVIRRKFVFINTAGISRYRRAVNSDTFLGWPPGTARLVGFSAKNQFKFGAQQQLWDVTARIQFREPYAGTIAAEAWYKRWRHEGLIVLRDGVVGRALDEFGQEKTKPVLLKVNGEEERNPNQAVFIHTQVYASLPYSALGLV